MSYDTDADYLYTQDDIDKLEADLAEARAQIAAKDAALREVLKGVLYVHGRGGLGLNVHETMDGWVGTINAALSAEVK